MAINYTTIAHIRLTVTDITRSREFYESVFNWPINLEMPEDADDATRDRLAFLFDGVIYNVGDSRVALRPVADDRVRRGPHRPRPPGIPARQQVRTR